MCPLAEKPKRGVWLTLLVAGSFVTQTSGFEVTQTGVPLPPMQQPAERQGRGPLGATQKRRGQDRNHAGRRDLRDPHFRKHRRLHRHPAQGHPIHSLRQLDLPQWQRHEYGDKKR